LIRKNLFNPSSISPDPMQLQNPKRRVNIITLGCPKNIFDSGLLIKQLQINKVDVVYEQEAAPNDLILINTCAFIKDAKQESIDHILHFIGLKNQGKIRELMVMGCLSQRYLQELIEELPEVDAFFGVFSSRDILQKLNIPFHPSYAHVPSLLTPSHYAYLKISDGCNHRCSFCAIPLIKGRHTSVPPDNCVQSALELAASGVKELIIIGQDITSYGKDLAPVADLMSLLESLSAIDNIQWIRLMYSNPSLISDPFLEALARNSKICRYLDIPLQHISDPVLKAMKRASSAVQINNLIHKIRNRIPSIALRTTFIVGFPGETEADFQNLCDFVKETEFERLGVFRYSDEEGTAAWGLKNKVPEPLIEERYHTLMALQRDIAIRKNKEKTGQILKVICDYKEGDHYICRSEYDAPEIDNELLVPEIFPLKTGAFYQVRVLQASEYDLIAECLNDDELS
jgi:ribosomal protein S12 methylthiotransferase